MDEEKKQNIFLILMVVCIICLIICIILFIKYKNLITTDPLIYGMEEHNFTSCSCYDGDGYRWDSTDDGFLKEEEMIEWDKLR